MPRNDAPLPFAQVLGLMRFPVYCPARFTQRRDCHDSAALPDGSDAATFLSLPDRPASH
jgi:hypothetical protein